MLITNNKIIANWQFNLLTLLSFSLPFPLIFSNIIIFVLCITIIIDIVANKRYFGQVNDSQSLLLIIIYVLFYLIHIIGLFYTDNLSTALYLLEKSLSILLFPLLLTNISTLTKAQIRIILTALPVSCFIAGIAMLILALHNNFLNTNDVFLIDWTYFTNEELAKTIKIHQTYFSLYVAFSIFILIFSIHQKWFAAPYNDTSLQGILILFFFLLLILLSARIVLVAIAPPLVALIIYIGHKRGHLIKGVIGAIMLITMLGISTIMIPPLRERFYEAINYNEQYSIDKRWGGRAMRLLKWECCLELIKQHPIIGVGTGDTQDQLQECYKNKNFDPLLHWPNVRFNAHNQYFQTFITVGIIGILLLMVGLAFPFIIAVKQGHILYVIFTFLFSVGCLTESMLEVNKGVVFYSFFNSLFAFHVLNKQ